MAEYAQGSDQEQGPALPPLPDIAKLGVGEALRQRREQLGWSIEDVAAWLRIRSVYLEALETGQANILPAEVYALGFLRTYGQALGFEPEQLLKCYRQEGRLGARKPELDFPDPPADRRLPPAVSISLGLAVILASYVGWYCFVGHVPPVPEHVPPVATLMPGESAKNAPSPQVASMLPDHNVAQLAPVPVVPQPVQPEGVAGAHEGAEVTAAPAHGVDTTVPPAQSAASDNHGAPEQQPVDAQPAHVQAEPATADASAPLTLKAVAPSWVQVKNAEGKVVYDHILQAGEAWTVPSDNGPYSLTVGNAGGIALGQGELTTPPLGRNGAVLRRIALTPDTLRQVQAGGGVASVPAPVAPATQAVGNVHAPLAETSAKSAASATASVPGGGTVAPVPAAKPPSHRDTPVAEPSADDLNARQLSGAGAH